METSTVLSLHRGFRVRDRVRLMDRVRVTVRVRVRVMVRVRIRVRGGLFSSHTCMEDRVVRNAVQ